MTEVIVVDDRPQIARESIVPAIRKGSGLRANQIRIITDEGASKELEHELGVLHSRQKSGKISGESSVFDNVPIVVIDYKLGHLDTVGGLMTGEELGKRIRRYTQCGLIVSLNRLPLRLFDLRLAAPPNAGADVSVHHEDLACPGLWLPSWPRGFRPWSWPSLLEGAASLQERRTAVHSSWQKKLSKVLAIPQELAAVIPTDVSILPYRFRGAASDLLEMTLEEIADALVESSDDPQAERPLPRSQKEVVVASFIGSWLEHTVLPTQETIIDAPHLVRLQPGLLKGKLTIENLNTLTSLKRGATLPLRPTKELKDARTGLDIWVNRPTWWTNRILDIVDEIPDGEASGNVVFAEDSSRFIPKEKATPFSSPGLFPERYLEGWKALGVDRSIYQPAAWLA